MTPAARIAAAIEILDQVLEGQPAEKLLTSWGRNNRFAGSKDRAAIRDHVFDALRCRRSFAALGGSESGRGLMLGLLRDQGLDPADFFSGEGYAPAVLEAVERGFVAGEPPEEVALDCPDWLAPQLRADLGAEFAPTLAALRQRAPVFLRVNTRKASPDQAIAALQADAISAQAHPLSPTALRVTANPRRIQGSAAFTDGLVELQDAASQAVCDLLPLRAGQTVLDLCAGGGGKSLALAARADLAITAHDIDPGRMRDIPARAARAGVRIATSATPEDGAPYDLVLADVPCSGSGAWRRSPEAKWRLTPERLAQLCQLQAQILQRAAQLTAPGGVLAYATCSMLNCENQDQIGAFMAQRPDWQLRQQRRFLPSEGGDGFYVAILQRG